MRHLLPSFAACLLGCLQAQAQVFRISPKEIAELRGKAELGDAESQCNIGDRYFYGQGVRKDEAAAMEWYRKSAGQGYARGQYRLGRGSQERGEFNAEAAKWIRAAAEQGFAEAQTCLGTMLIYHSPGVNANLPEALKWLRAAAEQGHAGAQDSLGSMYAEGKGVPADDDEAHKWWALAARQGSWHGKQMTDKRTELVEAAKGYGCSLAEAEVRLTFRKRVATLHASAEQPGDVEARFELAAILDKRVRRAGNTEGDFPYDEAEAEKWYRKAAEGAHAWAQYGLGNMYADRKGDSQSEAEAVKWLRRAADQGHVLAQLRLGGMYVLGKGVKRNETEGVKWIFQAAEGGSMTARWFLGAMHDEGIGVPKDEAEAVKYYHASAALGLPRAWCELGYRYANGKGVPKDEVEAAKWLLLAERDHWDDPRETFKSIRNSPNAHALLSGGERRMDAYHYSGEYPLAEKREAPEWSAPRGFPEYCRLAERGDAQMRFKIGMKAYDNLTEKLKWIPLAAKQGVAAAQYEFGQIYEKGLALPKDNSEAVQWYRKAAVQGYGDALTALGKMSEDGRILPQDAVELVGVFRSVAEEGNMRAQFGLARMYLQGRGVAKDASEAMKWFRKIADRKVDDVQVFAFDKTSIFWLENGIKDETQCEIGEMYFKGQGVPVDQAEGLKWFLRVVETKVYLRPRLGRIYEQGDGVPVDKAEAFKWYMLAGGQGRKAASTLKRSASPEEIAEGGKRALDYDETRKAAKNKEATMSSPATAK